VGEVLLVSSPAPNLFVVGAAKCGTTSVYRYLNSHPAIFMSARKEPHHFSRLRTIPELQPRLRQVLDDEAYLNLFAGARDEMWRGEASTSYCGIPAPANGSKPSRRAHVSSSS
jgi:hypothetical protein